MIRSATWGGATGAGAEAGSDAFGCGVRLASEVLATPHSEDAPVLDDETARKLFPAVAADELARLQAGYADEVRRAREEGR